MRRIAQMPAHDIDEGGIALGCPDRCHVTQEPDRGADEPKPQAEADSSGERAVDDRDRARRAAEQDRLGQGAMDRGVEPRHGFDPVHQSSAPPANWKKERKKLDAAKAIDRPKTI